MSELILAIVIGMAFGVALNRVGATNPQYIINMVRLTDLHLMKVIVFAIGFASALLFAGMAIGAIDPGHLSVKAMYPGVFIGGLILGVGFAIAGYCPGTGLAAAATGRLDGVVFILGGLLGAFAYTLGHAAIERTGLLDDMFGGKVTIAATANENFGSLISIVPGSITALVLAVLLMGLAAILPRAFAVAARMQTAT